MSALLLCRSMIHNNATFNISHRQNTTRVKRYSHKISKIVKKHLYIFCFWSFFNKIMSGIVLHSLIYYSIFKPNIVQFVTFNFNSLEHFHKSTFIIIDLDCDSFNPIVIDHLNSYSTVLYLLHCFHKFIFIYILLNIDNPRSVFWCELTFISNRERICGITVVKIS